jgi:hypothetical protein
VSERERERERREREKESARIKVLNYVCAYQVPKLKPVTELPGPEPCTSSLVIVDK